MNIKVPSDLYNMQMHIWYGLDKTVGAVMRVPGGWMYLISGHPVFVPFNNEAMNK